MLSTWNSIREFNSYPEIVLSIKSTASKLEAIYFFISGLELKKKKWEWQLKNWQG